MKASQDLKEKATPAALKLAKVAFVETGPQEQYPKTILVSLLGFLNTIALVEAFDTSCRVNELLCACKERVASRADFNLQILCRCLRLDDVSA